MIPIPDFADPRLGKLTVCCHLETSDRKILALVKKLPSSKDAMVTRITKGKVRLIVRLSGGGSAPGSARHLHVDIYRASATAAGRRVFRSLPKVNAKASDIQRTIEQFVGLPAAVSLAASYFVPIDDLPRDRGLIGPTIGPTKAGGTEIRQTRAVLTIGGGPIESVEWILRPDGREVWVELEAGTETTIGDDHLESPYDSLNAAFRLLILGERSNETRTEG